MQSNYITEASRKIKTAFKEMHVFDQVFVYTKDSISEKISLESVLDKLELMVPFHIGQMVDSIMIGDFPQLKRDPPILAFYEDGSLYVSNDPPNESAMIHGIVHELAHAIEEAMGLEIYSDGDIESEFLRKRISLKKKLEDYDIETLSTKFFMNCEYSQQFDDYLYDVGYEKLSNLMTGMYINPYSATSLREYFAAGFEEFLLGDKMFVQNISPVLYQKILPIVRQN